MSWLLEKINSFCHHKINPSLNLSFHKNFLKNFRKNLILKIKDFVWRCSMFKFNPHVKYGRSIFLVLLTLLIISSICFTSISFAAIPRYLSLQAKVTLQDGTPLTGTYSATFRIYEAATGGTALWSEAQTITFASGILDAVLGLTTAFPTTMTFNTDYWLSIEIGSDGEMSPRTRLTASPYALNSDKIDNIDSSQFVRTDADSTISANLTVNGNVVVGDASSDTFTLNSGSISFINATALNLANSSATSLNIESGLLNLDTLNSRVGIGTTAPEAKLQVLGGDAYIGTGTFNNASTNSDLYVKGNLEVDGTLYASLSGSTDVASTTSETFTVDSDQTGTEPADGSGFVIEGGSGDASLLWDATNNEIDINKQIHPTALVADTAAINAGTIDATAIGATTPAAGTFTTLTGRTSVSSGQASTTTGALALYNASSAYATSLQAGNAASAVTYTLPTTDGSEGQVLQTDGDGALSWATALTSETGDISSVTAGDGLTDGGTSGDVTLNVGAGTGISVGDDDVAVDTAVVATTDNSLTLTNKTIGSTGLVFSGATTDITTGTNENLIISPNGTGKVGIGITDPGEYKLNVNGAGYFTTLDTGSGAYELQDATTAAKGLASFDSGDFSVASGAVSLATGSVGSTELASTTVTPGDYGSASEVATFTVDSDGRITAAESVAIEGAAPTGAAGGDLTDTYPNPTIAENAVELGTDTTGNYVKSFSQGKDIQITNPSGEGVEVTIDIESQLDNVSAITIDSSDLTLATTTSGNIILSPVAGAFVGIGTTDPAYALDVDGTFSANSVNV
ncbi:MAG: hypothetical protein PHY46_03645, partial [Candidatus Omnitrophica bacterium]|nr:hypothetical protein [Candidatus Omnitrophota bacterium]